MPHHSEIFNFVQRTSCLLDETTFPSFICNLQFSSSFSEPYLFFDFWIKAKQSRTDAGKKRKDACKRKWPFGRNETLASHRSCEINHHVPGTILLPRLPSTSTNKRRKLLTRTLRLSLIWSDILPFCWFGLCKRESFIHLSLFNLVRPVHVQTLLQTSLFRRTHPLKI